MAKRIVGIDAGGTMVKAAVFDCDGTEVGSARRSNQVTYPAPGHTEIDPDDLWLSASAAVRSVLGATGTDPADVIGVSATGHGNGLYAVDANGRSVMPGIVSTDSRAAAVGQEWQRDGLGEIARPVILQRFWAGQTLSLLGWFERHRPATLERAAALFGSKDYVRARLAGELSTDVTEAAVCGLADLTTGAYATRLFDRLGLGGVTARLPPIRPSLAVAGSVTAEAAAATGLREATPVVRGLTDVVACAIGSGVTSPYQMAIIAGTFSVNQSLSRAARHDVAPMLQMPYPIGGFFISAECSATSASNLEWICRTFLQSGVASGPSVYDRCNGLVRQALSRPSSDILFLPFLFGGPGEAPSGLIGMTAAHDLADVLRAVFEGIAFAHRLDIDRLRQGGDAVPPGVGRLAGGAARSDVWPQIFADVLGFPIEVTDGTELGAKGAAMCVAVTLGLHADLGAAVAAMVRVVRRFQPDPARQVEAEAKFARFTAMVAALTRHGSRR